MAPALYFASFYATHIIKAGPNSGRSYLKVQQEIGFDDDRLVLSREAIRLLQ